MSLKTVFSHFRKNCKSKKSKALNISERKNTFCSFTHTKLKSKEDQVCNFCKCPLPQKVLIWRKSHNLNPSNPVLFVKNSNYLDLEYLENTLSEYLYSPRLKRCFLSVYPFLFLPKLISCFSSIFNFHGKIFILSWIFVLIDN